MTRIKTRRCKDMVSKRYSYQVAIAFWSAQKREDMTVIGERDIVHETRI